MAWRSEPLREDEVFGVLLWKAGRVTAAQLATSLDLMNDYGLRQGEALVEMDVLDPGEVPLLLRTQCALILQSVLAEPDGEWAFTPGPVSEEEFDGMTLRVPPIVFRHRRDAVRSEPASVLAAVLRPRLDQYLHLVRPAASIASELKVSVSERRLLHLVEEEPRRMRSLFAVSPLSRSVTATILHTLNELGLLEFHDEPERGERPRDDAGREVAVRARIAKKGTLFEALRLHWLCVDADVEAAWADFRKNFHEIDARTLKGTGPADLELVIARGAEAYATLGDARKRRAYRLTVIERDIVVQSALIAASRAEMAMIRGDYAEAATGFAHAHELIPTRTTFRERLDKALEMAGRR